MTLIHFLRIIGVIIFTVSLSALSQDYPDKPVRLIVPYPPGGSTDVLGRLIGAHLSETLGKTFVVDNRPAVDGIIGTELVARANPDGYTFLIISTSHAVNVALGRKLPYDTIKDFAPVTHIANQQLLLVVHPSLPVKSVAEFIEYLKARPGKLDYASTSNATALPVELFKKMSGTDIRHIPFKGAGQVTNALLGGEVQISMPGAVAVLAHVRSGKLRALGIGDLKRSALLPDVPTIAESGVRGYQAAIWSGIVAPAKTPQPIVALINREILRVLSKAEFKERVALLGADAVGDSPEQWQRFLLSEIRKWGEIAKVSHFANE